MESRDIIRRKAIRKAFQLRRDLSLAREDAANSFDIASKIGIEIRFMDLPSLEGMFTRKPHPLIILPSFKHRPKGRILFTCAHEIGHFQLGHPPTVDERKVRGEELQYKSHDEIAADTFAAYFLMPRQAVLQRLARHNTDPIDATPTQLFQTASELGVGYSTLLTHMRLGLEVVDENWLNLRRRVTPKAIREEIIGDHRKCNLALVDKMWPNVPLELEVDDVVAVPVSQDIKHDVPISEMAVRSEWRLFTAIRPGIGHMKICGTNISVRISRREFCGLFNNRYLEDPDIA